MSTISLGKSLTLPIVEIGLSDSECAYAEYLAQRRCDSFEHEDYEKTTYNGDSYEVHLRGAKSEIAFAKHYQLAVDSSVRYRGDKTDFKLQYRGDEVTVDVKSTTYDDDPWLWVRETKTNSDWYVCTYLSGTTASTVRLVGWASIKRVLTTGDYIESPVSGEHHMNYRLKKPQLKALPGFGSLTAISE